MPYSLLFDSILTLQPCNFHFLREDMAESEFPVRNAAVTRTTRETDVSVRLALDGSGTYANDTSVGFLDHMLDLFARHGQFDLEVKCTGDLHVDDHHTVEDVAITLGMAVRKALGGKAYITRYGHAYVPMDESLARAVVDLSGRLPFSMRPHLTVRLSATCPPSLCVISGTVSQSTPPVPCISPSFTATIRTTRLRPFSRRWPVPCAQPYGAIATARPCHLLRACCSLPNHIRS